MKGPNVPGTLCLAGGGGGGRYLIPETSLVEASTALEWSAASAANPLVLPLLLSSARGAPRQPRRRQTRGKFFVQCFPTWSKWEEAGACRRGWWGLLELGWRGFGLRQCDCDSLVACTAATGALLNSEGASGQLLGQPSWVQAFHSDSICNFLWTQWGNVTHKPWITGVSNPLRKPILS